MYEDYRAVELEFSRRTDALCELEVPAKCDCSRCPARDMCEWLVANDPYKEG